MVENEVLRSWDLDGKNLVGIGSDGASVTVGKNNLVATFLKKDWPHLILMRCICHALDLIAKKSFKEHLPSSLDYLLRESYNWFSHSALR